MVCMAPSTYFCFFVFYSFSTILKHVFPFRARSTISAIGLGCLLEIRGREVSFPLVFV